MAAPADRGNVRREYSYSARALPSRSSTFPTERPVRRSSQSSGDKTTDQHDETHLPESIAEPRPHALRERSISSHEPVPQAPGEDGMTASIDDRPRSSVVAARQNSESRQSRTPIMLERPKSHSAANEKPRRARNTALENARNREPNMSSYRRILGITVPRSAPGTGDALEATNVLEHCIQDLEQRVEKRDKLIQKLEGDFSAHTKTIEELRDQLAQRESQIAAIQGQHFETLRGQGMNMAKDDDDVRSALQSCITGWRVWAKKYALKDLPDSSDIFRHLWKSHLVSNNGKFNREHAARLGFMLLNAELSKFISDWIIQHTFLCLEGLNAAGSINIPLGFELVYKKLLQGKEFRLSITETRLSLHQKIMVEHASGDRTLSDYSKTLRTPQRTPTT